MLHLMGYDHADEEEAVEMEGREGVILAGIGVRRP
jgi:probable rRNA maturation factor